MTRTVLVPLDGSDVSGIALGIARTLHQRIGGTLKLLSVVELSTEFDAWIETASYSVDDELDEWLKERREYLHSIAREIDGDVETEVRVGRPANEICAAIGELEDVVVVMASHGRSGIQQVVLGSVAMTVVHETHSPVVIVRMVDDALEPPTTIGRVLLPTDGTPFSETVIRTALDIVGEPKPDVRLIQALEQPDWSQRSINAGLVSQYLEAGKELSENHLEDLKSALAERGYEAEAELRAGSAADAILAAASEYDVDLIAMSTHGRGSVGRVLLGSVAQRVLQRSTVPLMLIHTEAE